VEDYLSEKEQWEWIKGLLRDNGPWALAGIAVAAVGMAGWRWYGSHQDALGAEASAKYSEILKDFGEDKSSQAFVLIGELERDFSSSPYVDQAKLAAARVYVETNELDKAANELQAVAQRARDPELATLAKLRLARIQIAQNKPDLAITTVNGLQGGAFGPRYHEIMGDAYYAKGDKPNALKEYLSAKMGDLTGSADGQLLDLKISDLSADGVRAPTTPAPAAANNAAAK
jgi:predicted negative regulator of RcsB-dependent stress response